MKAYLITLAAAVVFAACGKKQAENQPPAFPMDKVFSQQEIMELLLPVLKSEGTVFRKHKTTLARKAVPGETIETHTADGLETVNTAEEGDFVIKNQTDAGEMYIVPADKFNEKYAFSKAAANGFSEYTPLGKAIGVELTPALLGKLQLPGEFKFVAAWDEEMLAKEGDFLVSPPGYSEIYRIARKEFFETYVAE